MTRPSLSWDPRWTGIVGSKAAHLYISSLPKSVMRSSSPAQPEFRGFPPKLSCTCYVLPVVSHCGHKLMSPPPHFQTSSVARLPIQHCQCPQITDAPVAKDFVSESVRRVLAHPRHVSSPPKCSQQGLFIPPSKPRRCLYVFKWIDEIAM